jgi:L-amino acid N-acyltransferase
VNIRPARPADLPAIVDIYNHAILHTTATFDLVAKSLGERAVWFSQFDSQHPVFVAAGEDGEVLGFAHYLPYRPRAGYAGTKEVTVYVAERARRCGVASGLYDHLIQHAIASGVHVLIAVIGDNNPQSFALHERFGFASVGVQREVGFKFGRWIDMHVYHRILDPPGA